MCNPLSHPAIHARVHWIRSTADRARGLLIPISGGSDGALCFWLCAKALPEKAHGVYVGSHLRARDWFEATGPVETISQMESAANPEIARWGLFLSLSLQKDYWLVGTRNRTEDTLGTFSLASRVATYLPIVGLWKSEVMDLCRSIGVPEEVTQSSRRADPECGRPAELAEIPPDAIDRFMQTRLGLVPTDACSSLTPEQYTYLECIYQRNQFKRLLPLCGPI